MTDFLNFMTLFKSHVFDLAMTLYTAGCKKMEGEACVKPDEVYTEGAFTYKCVKEGQFYKTQVVKVDNKQLLGGLKVTGDKDKTTGKGEEWGEKKKR